MKYLNGSFYVEVKDEWYIFHPSEKILFGLWDQPKSLRTQYEVLNKTLIRKNQKANRINDDELVVKNYLKKTNNYSTSTTKS